METASNILAGRESPDFNSEKMVLLDRIELSTSPLPKHIPPAKSGIYRQESRQ
ncbi:hypothetical protein [Komagataeibacter xylinus]|uniref:hypothetical protein n=1 Tax=Komagataeibacter xylinus TaxID=28448 RepID=UPI0013302478|nr:hypothetical protein [Komagataeibacter xylinus]